jgi:hypothetical protein
MEENILLDPFVLTNICPSSLLSLETLRKKGSTWIYSIFPHSPFMAEIQARELPNKALPRRPYTISISVPWGFFQARIRFFDLYHQSRGQQFTIA